MTKGNKSCQCFRAMVMWGHHYSPTALRVSVVRDRRWERETRENAEWNTLQFFPYFEHHFRAPSVYIMAVLPVVESSNFCGKWDSLCHEDWWSPLTSATEALSPFENSNQAFLSVLFEAPLPYLIFKCCWLWTCPVWV